MGARGPTPKRSSERRRRNKESKPETVRATGVVKTPPVLGHWHPMAKAWFKALGESGQAQYFEPSDWQAARLVAETMTSYLKAKKPSAMMFSHLWSAMADLLTTEASRRRVRMEVERELGDEPDEAAEVARLDEYRQRLAG